MCGMEKKASYETHLLLGGSSYHVPFFLDTEHPDMGRQNGLLDRFGLFLPEAVANRTQGFKNLLNSL